MKLQQIDEETFIKLREEILGDEVKDRAKLVKGLDWGLLERVRRGEVGVEDVLEGAEKKSVPTPDDEDAEDVDDEFEKLEERVGDLDRSVQDAKRAMERVRGLGVATQTQNQKINLTN